MQEEIEEWRNLFLSINASKLQIKCCIKGGAPLAIHTLSLLPSNLNSFQQVLSSNLFKDWDFTITLLNTNLLIPLIPDTFLLSGIAVKVLRYKTAAKNPETKDYLFEASIFNKKDIITNYVDMEVPLSLFYIELDTINSINNFFNMLLGFYNTSQSVQEIINYSKETNIKCLMADQGFFERSIDNIDFGKLENYKDCFMTSSLLPHQMQFITSNYNQLDRLLIRLPMKLLPKSNKIKKLLTDNNVNLPSWILDVSYINGTVIAFNEHLYNSLFKTSNDKLLHSLKQLLKETISQTILCNEIKNATIRLSKLPLTNTNYENVFQYKIILEKIKNDNISLERVITEYSNDLINLFAIKVFAQLSTELTNFYISMDKFFNNCNLIRVYELFLQIKKSDETMYELLINNIKNLFSQFLLSTYTPHFKLLYKVKLQKNILPNSYVFFKHID